MSRRLRFLLAGLALIAVTNGIAIGGALSNRAAAESTLVLSQRELRVPYLYGLRSESSGLALRLAWRTLDRRVEHELDELYRFAGGRLADWLGAEMLGQLGFDVSVAADAEGAGRHYARQLARSAVLVLELDGPAYALSVRRAQARVAAAEANSARVADPREAQTAVDAEYQRLAREQKQASRLFVVDGGPDAAALRARYPDTARYALARGRVDISVCEYPKEAPFVCGRIADLDVVEINVPLALRPVFEGAKPAYGPDEPEVRFTASVAWGRRLEPWLTAAERAAAP